MPEAIPVVDLFAGAGGLSLGLRDAGFEPVAAVEAMEEAAATYEAAHGVAVDRRRVEELPLRELRALRGRATVVAGGPPCQPWSTGGLRRGAGDPRDGFGAMLRALEAIRPDAFVVENVAGLQRGRARPAFVALVDALVGLGYAVSAQTLDAADFGVPQRRRRLFLVGVRDPGRPFAFPEPTHGPGRASAWVPAGTAVGAAPAGEPNPSAVTYAKRPDLRPSPYDGLLVNGGGRPIDLTAPARTVLASAGGNKTAFVDTLGVLPDYHARLWRAARSGGEEAVARLVRGGRVDGARRLTVEESAALQTFPPGMAFAGS
ncbi:MAG TPA: DNA cytosine methyltransferase, partial [Capillimicrobium sp.]